MPELADRLTLLKKDSTPEGTIQLHQLDQQRHLSYYLFLPEKLSAKTKVLVCVHGISRNAEQQITAFHQQANSNNHIIIAPRFSKKHYRGYQRLEVGAAGLTAADALNRILHHVQETQPVKTDRISLFGYSGGAQFSHRYSMLYPEKINALFICSAGWFTFPNEDQKYPYGLSGSMNTVSKMRENLPTFLKLKTRILVGELDNTRDPGLNTKQCINRQQGYHRLERANRWISALQKKCTEMNLEADLRFITIKACGHSFEDCARLGDIGQYIFPKDN